MNVRRLGPEAAADWRKAVEKLVPGAERDHELISAAEAARALADKRCYVLIAEAETNPVGLLTAYRFPGLEAGGQLVYLYNIEVESEFRKRGIGRELIRMLKEYCAGDKVTLIWAGTERDNIAARTLFASTGASLAGETYAEYEWRLWEDEI